MDSIPAIADEITSSIARYGYCHIDTRHAIVAGEWLIIRGLVFNTYMPDTRENRDIQRSLIARAKAGRK